MATQLPASPNIFAINPISGSASISRLPQKIVMLSPDPSVIVTLSRTSPLPLTYSNKGVIKSPPLIMPEVTLRTATSQVVANIPVNPAATAHANSAFGISTQQDKRDIADVIPPVPRNLLAESNIQAQANITANPAYANSVAALFVKVINLGFKRSLTSAMENSAYRVQPISRLTRISQVKKING